MDSDERKELVKFLKSQRLMTLATFEKMPWICTVYYVFDKELNLYFVSSPNSKHSYHIQNNRNVACAIYDSHTPNSALKVGLQIQGVASQVKSWERTRVLLKMWHRAAPGAEEIVNVRNMMNKVISSRVYKIRPTLIQFFNQKLYGDEEYEVFKI